MPVLLAVQPVLVPFTVVTGAVYAFARKEWLRINAACRDVGHCN